MSRYSKKHYEDIASIINLLGFAPAEHFFFNTNEKREGAIQMHEGFLIAFTEMFTADNPRFDREKFIEACK